jgi:hypothetical protein
MTHMAFGATRNIGMPIIRIGYIDTIQNGRSSARNGGKLTTEVIPNGSDLLTGDGTRCGPTAPMIEVTSGVVRDGGASGTRAGSMPIIPDGPSRIRDGFERTTAGTLSGFIQHTGTSILATGTILARNTEESSAGTWSISIPTMRVQRMHMATRTIMAAAL